MSYLEILLMKEIKLSLLFIHFIMLKRRNSIRTTGLAQIERQRLDSFWTWDVRTHSTQLSLSTHTIATLKTDQQSSSMLFWGNKWAIKKSREFSLTGGWGGGSSQFPTYFIIDFVKEWVKWIFLTVLFCVPSEVKKNPKNPKILWEIFNLTITAVQFLIFSSIHFVPCLILFCLSLVFSTYYVTIRAPILYAWRGCETSKGFASVVKHFKFQK